MTPEISTQPKTTMKFSLDLRWVILLLVAVIAAMLFIWKPWSSGGTSDRTIEVTGDATIKATPDEFVFYPSYQFKNANKEAALAELTAKSEAITGELKKLGVEEKDIKTNSSGYDYAMPEDSDGVTYALQLTVTVGDEELAQKVQDYLVTTAPVGSVSPYPAFSEAKQKELESQARDQATKDARQKAEQSGKNLGFKVGKVKSVSDGTGFSMPFYGRGEVTTSDNSAKSLQLYPGENELPYSVTVVYYIR